LKDNEYDMRIQGCELPKRYRAFVVEEGSNGFSGEIR
jgi:hypothetical protein